MIEISDRDILRSKLVTPGWYLVKVESVTEKMSKDGNSTNWVVEGTILENDDTGNKDFAGVPTPYWNFNSKAPGFAVGFIAAVSRKDVAKGRYSLESATGKEVAVKITNELFEGRMVNRLPHEYRIPRKAQQEAAKA
jgi:hypothetical protein